MGTSVRLAAARPRKTGPKCPGTVYNNNGHWYWRVRLPGAKHRTAFPLKMPGSERAMSADKPFVVAEQAAWRAWEAAVHADKRRPCGSTVNDICNAWIVHAWSTDSYRRAIANAAKCAHASHWSPNQLRHAFATQVRRAYGLEATRAVLGHSAGARITDRYSYAAIEDEIIRAASPAVEALG